MGKVTLADPTNNKRTHLVRTCARESLLIPSGHHPRAVEEPPALLGAKLGSAGTANRNAPRHAE